MPQLKPLKKRLNITQQINRKYRRIERAMNDRESKYIHIPVGQSMVDKAGGNLETALTMISVARMRKNRTDKSGRNI